jgi:hypothetical protein
MRVAETGNRTQAHADVYRCASAFTGSRLGWYSYTASWIGGAIASHILASVSDVRLPRGRGWAGGDDCLEVGRFQPKQSICFFKRMDNAKVAVQVLAPYLVHPAHAVVLRS